MNTDAVSAKSALLEAAEKECWQAMNLIGPQADNSLMERYPTLVQHPDSVGIRYCAKCTPPAQTWTCVFCDWQFDEHWKLKAHYVYEPSWCRQRAARKVAAWSAKS